MPLTDLRQWGLLVFHLFPTPFWLSGLGREGWTGAKSGNLLLQECLLRAKHQPAKLPARLYSLLERNQPPAAPRWDAGGHKTTTEKQPSCPPFHMTGLSTVGPERYSLPREAQLREQKAIKAKTHEADNSSRQSSQNLSVDCSKFMSRFFLRMQFPGTWYSSL